MNGMVTRLELRADEVGTYQGLSSHFSGDGFPGMMFDVHVVSPTQFADWATGAARGASLDRRAYEGLAKQSMPKDKPLYRLADPELFRDIATQKIPPGPGPQLTDNLERPKSDLDGNAGNGAGDAR
jgi:cytochrome o ubiquinol oxidase subunit 2